jgi:hypothetical protein
MSAKQGVARSLQCAAAVSIQRVRESWAEMLTFRAAAGSVLGPAIAVEEPIRDSVSQDEITSPRQHLEDPI